MTLAELKEAAAAILAIAPAAGYVHVTFETKCRGIPDNIAGVPVVHEERSYAYSTVRYGSLDRGSVTVECRDTGCVDARNRRIYEHPSGLVFVYKYYPGSAESRDRGVLMPPEMSI